VLRLPAELARVDALLCLAASIQISLGGR
jgi:hypothetical protein